MHSVAGGTGAAARTSKLPLPAFEKIVQEWVATANGVATLDFYLPRQGVSLVRVTW